MNQNVRVTNNEAERRYEIALNGQRVGLAEYQPEGDTLILTHTEVAEGHEGEGLASQLVQAALDDARARGLRVVPVCRFVAAYIQRHPEYADLVREEELG
ncbi:GNAT family N-acetyltransferase [Deinococcus sp. YIM 77859]|uniref:GNAT family N-acetyltransferase n=1 Tax=Deinococcus sp. YIM 77859 TaxID=1540221 RepID=UPI000556A060|nr:GNAT family N-acetyltransferase [Deinococcus sp. YIM 77859]